jgi:hypothetical protein
MDRYAQLLMDLVTKPKTATSTSTTTATQPKQGLDLSSLLMMLMFSGIFDKDKQTGVIPPAMPWGIEQGPGTVGPRNTNAGIGGVGGNFLPSSILGETPLPAPGVGLPGGMTIQQLIQMLKA